MASVRTNPRRIYDENIRAVFKWSQEELDLWCELGLRNGLIKKKTAVVCPNSDCRRFILSKDYGEKFPNSIICERCEMLEEERFEFKVSELETTGYYQIALPQQ